MKILLLGLFLIPILCKAQTKKDTRIIVTIADTTNLMDRLSSALYEAGYSIAQRDDKAKFIATDEKVLKAGWPSNIKLRVLIKDSVMVFTGDVKVNMTIMNQEPSYQPVIFVGSKGSIAKLSWEEMDKIAKQFGEVKYSK